MRRINHSSRFIEMFGTLDSPKVPVKRMIEVSKASGQYGLNASAVNYIEGKPRYIRITDICDDGSLNDDIKCSDIDDSTYSVNKGDVLFARTGATVGKTYLHRSGDACFAGYLIRYSFTEAVDPEYILAYTHSDTYYDWVLKSQKVGAQPNISASQYDNMPILIPGRKEQEAFLCLYRQADKSKFSDFKSRFIAWSSEWKSHTTIRDLVDTSADKASRKFKPEDIIRYIDISSVDGESNSVIGTTEYIFSEAPSRAQQCTRKGDILVSTVRPNLKNIAVNQLDEDNLVASSGFCVLRPKEEYSGLILAYVLSEPFTLKMVAEAKGSNYPAIHDSDILDYPITVPESHELASVGVFVQQADKSKYLN